MRAFLFLPIFLAVFLAGVPAQAEERADCRCTKPDSTTEFVADQPLNDCTKQIMNVKFSRANGYNYTACEPQPACWCRNEVKRTCQLLDDSTITTPELCSTQCSEIDNTREWEALPFTAGADYDATPFDQGGCQAPSAAAVSGACWCQVAGSGCQQVSSDASGRPILDEQQCAVRCAAGAGKFLVFDTTGADLSKDADCTAAIAGHAPVAPTVSEKTATEREAELNKLRDEAKASLKRATFTSPGQIAGQMLLFFVVFLGMFAFVMYIVAGVMWMFAAGNAERIEHAKKILVWVTLGVVAALSSFVIVRFILFDLLQVPPTS